jgi:hypothetical protein
MYRMSKKLLFEQNPYFGHIMFACNYQCHPLVTILGQNQRHICLSNYKKGFGVIKKKFRLFRDHFGSFLGPFRGVVSILKMILLNSENTPFGFNSKNYVNKPYSM